MLARLQILILVSLLLLSGCGPAQNNTKVVEQHLAAAIPLQSSSTQVLNYLNIQKIAHSQSVDRKSIQAMIRSKPSLSIVKTDYGVVFRFNDHDRLIGYDVRPVYTGP
jgi:hypothetical protein